MITNYTYVVPSMLGLNNFWPQEPDYPNPAAILSNPFPSQVLPSQYFFVSPSLVNLGHFLPSQPVLNKFISPQLQVTASVTVSYKVQTTVVATAIIGYNIGVALSSQIRQTAADRTDFAY